MSKLKVEEFEALKKKYVDVREFCIGRKVEEVQSEDGTKKEVVIEEGKYFYIRRPDRGTLKYASTKQFTAQGGLDPISPGEAILSKCWVGGDEDIKSKDELFFPACSELTVYMQEIMGLY